ncbi:MAG: GNAT family N-acetyltransferase [Anaerolineaceae bacterium]|nr:GNAT family N-acetyltransferase [Anaerolineaceae bacterium]
MSVIRYETPAQFKEAVFPFLLRDEAVHNIQLGVIADWLEAPERYDEAYLASVHVDGKIIGTAMMTLPHPLQLSLMKQDAVELLIAHIRRDYPRIAGVGGPVNVASAFAHRWADVTGQKHKLSAGMDQRIYELTEVKPARPVPGAMRPATQADKLLIAAWYAAFYEEAMDEPKTIADVMPTVDIRLSKPTSMLYVWEVDGQVVSMCGVSGPTENGIRVNAVYTPPEQRGKGYASANVAAVSQLMLDSGRRYCFLFTDLANPTSNSIYQKIGYHPVTDMSMIAFAGD